MALRAIAVGHGCKNAFLLQSSEERMVPVLNILLCKMYAKHFPLENVRKNIFLHQIHFSTAEHFLLENVRKNLFLQMQHNCSKNAFLQPWLHFA